ncbi:hypothetical protein BVX93_01155 [bacterium B13(2017)]|nr:hypothetical protein BVX93_01155 [bacterium B13(2017)]
MGTPLKLNFDASRICPEVDASSSKSISPKDKFFKILLGVPFFSSNLVKGTSLAFNNTGSPSIYPLRPGIILFTEIFPSFPTPTNLANIISVI